MIKFFKKKYLNRLCKVCSATLNDVEFVVDLIAQDAKKGHYSELALRDDELKNYRLMFTNLINSIGTPVMGENGVEYKKGSLWIYLSKNEKIGFFYLVEKYQGSGEKDLEISMFSIAQKHRGKGHGEIMIKKILSMCSNTATLFARCFKNSTTMCYLLEKYNFKTVKIRESGLKEFQYDY